MQQPYLKYLLSLLPPWHCLSDVLIKSLLFLDSLATQEPERKAEFFKKFSDAVSQVWLTSHKLYVFIRSFPWNWWKGQSSQLSSSNYARRSSFRLFFPFFFLWQRWTRISSILTFSQLSSLSLKLTVPLVAHFCLPSSYFCFRVVFLLIPDPYQATLVILNNLAFLVENCSQSEIHQSISWSSFISYFICYAYSLLRLIMSFYLLLTTELMPFIYRSFQHPRSEIQHAILSVTPSFAKHVTFEGDPLPLSSPPLRKQNWSTRFSLVWKRWHSRRHTTS